MKRIMVIDDDQGIQQVVRIMLKNEGYEVITASSGQEGLGILEKKTPDFLFLDIMMPEMDGWEVLKKIKDNPKFKSIPVAMLTVKPLNKETLNNQGLEELVDYVTKPFTLEDILQTLKQMQ